MRLRNVSPYGALEVAVSLDPPRRAVIGAGAVFEVPDDLGAHLLEQVGNYEPADEE